MAQSSGRQRQRGYQLQFGFPLFGSRYTRMFLSTGVMQIRYSDAAADITDGLRRAGVRTDRAYDHRSYKAQMKQAMRSTAPLALVIEASGWTIRTLTTKGEPASTTPATAADDLRKRLLDTP